MDAVLHALADPSRRTVVEALRERQATAGELAALLPMAFGGVVLQSAVIDLHLPLLGDLHLVSSVLFDVGVYLVVVGLVLDLLRALGSHIDRDIQRAMREAEAEAEAA